jgi:hypothetical protein
MAGRQRDRRRAGESAFFAARRPREDCLRFVNHCDDAGLEIGGGRRSVLLVLAEFADVMLGVEFKPELGNKIELGFEKIDVLLFVVHQLLE